METGLATVRVLKTIPQANQHIRLAPRATAGTLGAGYPTRVRWATTGAETRAAVSRAVVRTIEELQREWGPDDAVN